MTEPDGASAERVRRVQAGAKKKREAVRDAKAALERARAPYLAAADELLSLMAIDAPKDLEHAARKRMWAAHPPVAEARRALADAEAKKR